MSVVTKTIKFVECRNFVDRPNAARDAALHGLISDGINSVKVQIATNLELYSKEGGVQPNAAARSGEINYQDSFIFITGSGGDVDRLIESIKTYQGGGFIKRKKKSKKKKKKKSKSKKKKKKSKK
jgi:hypothetical protein